MTLKQGLLTLHRYLGLAGCLLFLTWFLSGLVMMYVEMPYLQRGDGHLDGLAPLRNVVASAELLAPATAVAQARRAVVGGATFAAVPQRLFIEVQDGAPVWRVVPLRGPPLTLAADSGRPLGPWSPEQALRTASDWVRRRGAPWLNVEGQVALHFERTIEVDQWTLDGGQFGLVRPLHRFRVEGPSGALVYVSETSGAVVQATTRRQRVLAYVGPVAHWFYPTFLRRHGSLWSNVVIATSALGVLLVLAGLVLGIWNLRWTGSGVASPYKRRWMRWHHVFGLLFGLVALTWVFSGLLSMEPVDWAPSTAPSPDEATHLAGGEPDWSAFAVGPEAALEALARELEVKRLEPLFVAARPYWLAWETPRKSSLLAADLDVDDLEVDGRGDVAGPDDVGAPRPMAELPAAELESIVAGLLPAASLIEWVRLEDYDGYYTSKRWLESRRRLPVYRATFDDDERTSYYIDPHTGTIALRMKPRSRMNRVLYQGLHSWDLFGFANRRPWWDLVVGGFMLGGTLLALSGVVIGAQWLRRVVVAGD